MILNREQKAELHMKYATEPMKMLGYWKDKWNREGRYRYPSLPDPHDYIDKSWSKGERATIIKHLQAGEYYRRWMGRSECRICGKSNGSCCLTDGTYIWPQGFAHYIEKHYVKPPQEFIDHVLS